MLIETQPLTGYPEPYGLLCAMLQDGTRTWRGWIDPDLPIDAVVWQPYPNAHSIGAIILHIVGAEIYWFEQFALDRPFNAEELTLTMRNEIKMVAGHWPTPPREPISWYFNLHDRIRARTLESIKEWRAPEETRDWRGTPLSMRWVLGYVIQHESYHGGQAVLLNSLWRHGHSDAAV